MQDRIRSRFDETLARHFERLIGTREGISGLPLNLATISCLVLLAEREVEIENVSSGGPGRYTVQTLLSEAADIGITSDNYLHAALLALRERGYVDTGEDGRLITGKPALSMARLLNLVFPKMKGIAFLAYAGQALDEVVTDRADIHSAIDRFNQTLNLHGVSPGKQKPEKGIVRKAGLNGGAAAVSGRAGSERAAAKDLKRVQTGREEILLKLKEQSKAARPSSGPSRAPLAPRSGSDSADSKPLRREDEAPKKTLRPGLEETPRSADEQAPTEALAPVAGESQPPPPVEEAVKEIPEGVSRAEAEMPVQEEPTREQVPEQAQETETAEALEDSSDHVQAGEENHLEDVDDRDDDDRPSAVPDEDERQSIFDSDVEKRVVDFEKRLALICPFCKTHVLTEKSTEAGKVFYVCPDEICGFISWGRPHHIECARCKNPFMVEADSASGEKILKCPRATCQYKRRLNPARKVVRRRVVRRKA